MTHHVFDYGQGGLGNGKYRHSSQAASSGTAQASHLANQGTGTYTTLVSFPGTALWTPAEPLKDAGISAGEIVGYRCWIVKGKYLCSVFMGHRWYPGRAMSEGGDGGPPDFGGTGVHSFKDRDTLMKEYHETQFPNPIVYGTIYMWGKVVEHERGYRAEHAMIRSLDLLLRAPPYYWTYIENRRKLDKVRKFYGVGCED